MIMNMFGTLDTFGTLQNRVNQRRGISKTKKNKAKKKKGSLVIDHSNIIVWEDRGHENKNSGSRSQ